MEIQTPILLPEELQELESIVDNLYEQGNSENQQEIMDTWFKDIDYFPKIKSVIEISIPDDSKVKLAHFGLRACFLLLEHICPTWSREEFMEMALWCRNIFNSQIERFISVPILMQAFCNMYSQLVLYGWHISEGFENFAHIFKFVPIAQSNLSSTQFWQQMLSSSPFIWIGKIRIFTDIVAKMTSIHKLETEQVKEFKEVALLQCFHFGVHTLELILDKKMPQQFEEEIFQLIDQSLQLISACLCFGIDSSENEDTNQFKILIPQTWAANSQFSQIIDKLFQMYAFTPPNIQTGILNVIYLFSSAQTDAQTLVAKDRVDYANVFFTNLTNVLDTNLENIVGTRENLHIIVKTMLKIISLTTEAKFESIPYIPAFPNFIKALYNLTKAVFNIEIIIDSPEIIIDILHLWVCVAETINTCAREYYSQSKSLSGNRMILEKHTFNFDTIEPAVVEAFVITVKQMISDVVETYINFITHDALENYIENPDTFSSEDKIERMQMEKLLIYVVDIGKVTGIPFYESLLKSYNDLLQAYMKDQSNVLLELQLGTFAIIISPIAFQKITRSVTTIRLILAHTLGFTNHQFSHDDGLSKAASLPFSVTEGDAEGIDSGVSLIEDANPSMAENLNYIYDQAVVGILYLLLEASNPTEPNKNENIFLEDAILRILGKFIQTIFINKNPFTLPQATAEQFNVKTTNDLYPKFIKRITWAIIAFPQNRHIISLAMNAMTEWAKAAIKSMTPYLTHSEPTSEDGEETEESGSFLSVLYDIYHSNLAEFFETTEHIKHLRVQFFQIIGQIFGSIPDPQIINPIFESMEKRYELAVENKDEHLIQGLLLDLRGILCGINDNTRAYSIIFSFICPKLQTFHEAALSSNILVFSYFKFLNELTNDTNSRIKFSPKSADGLRLAKAVMFFVIAFFDNAPKSLDSSSKGLYYSMIVLKNIFTSSYSDLGAIIAYEDPILVQLFTSFLNFAHAADFNEIVHYPKNLKITIELLDCLFPNFIDYIVNIDISFLQTALMICAYVPRINPMITIAFKVINRITEFCVSTLNTEKGAELFENMNGAYNMVLTVLEELILKMPFSMSFHQSTCLYEKLIECTKNVLRMGPSNWPEIRQRLLVFLKSPSNQDVRGLIDDLVSEDEPK